jgi:hypothetical protein
MAIDDPVDLVDNMKGTSDIQFFSSPLIEIVAQETHNAQQKINKIRNLGSAVSISDMFEMQMRMNRLSQYSEMSTSVVSAANSAISSMARNVK